MLFTTNCLQLGAPGRPGGSSGLGDQGGQGGPGGLRDSGGPGDQGGQAGQIEWYAFKKYMLYILASIVLVGGSIAVKMKKINNPEILFPVGWQQGFTCILHD